ncbi:MAG: ABC transporter permease, partial [Oceanisphaera sp.]|nr:ABC transporter permease [Oceanisphaera sp.]
MTTDVSPSRWARFKQSDFLYHFRRDRVAMVSFAVFVALLAAALLSPIIAPHNPYDLATIDILDSELPPRWLEMGDERFLLGTDVQGRDILSTILYGSRVSLIIG